MTHDRRDFLKRSGAALSAAALSSCGPDGASDGAAARSFDGDLLRAVATTALPTELDATARERAVQAFQRWCDAYEPVAELNHGYGTHEIRYSPPDPVPAWQAQLQALDLEAAKRHGSGLVGLEREQLEELVRRHVTDEGPGLPSPQRARHVVVALMAHWFSSADAVDRCYGVRISPQTCRGIDSAPREPEALT